MTIIVDTKREARQVMFEHCSLSKAKHGALRQADHLMEIVHADQYRSTGELFVTHTNGVEHIVVMIGFAPDHHMRIASKLHDIIEDCQIEDRERLRIAIRKEFGWRVYAIVEALTRKEGADYPTQIKQAIRRYHHLGLWRIIFVKLADILFNLSTIEGFRNFAKEMRQYEKAEILLREVLTPSRRYVPRKHKAKFDELLANVTDLLAIKRNETIQREQQRKLDLLNPRLVDLGYFPTL